MRSEASRRPDRPEEWDGIPFSALTVVLPGVGDYAKALTVSDAVTVGAAGFRALTLEALIASKRAVRRKKDVEHRTELEALLELRKRESRG